MGFEPGGKLGKRSTLSTLYYSLLGQGSLSLVATPRFSLHNQNLLDGQPAAARNLPGHGLMHLLKTIALAVLRDSVRWLRPNPGLEIDIGAIYLPSSSLLDETLTALSYRDAHIL